jgi:hypothetical protein
VKSTYDERWKGYEMAFEAGTISELPKRLNVVREVTTEKLEGESDEVKAEVERFQQDHVEGLPSDSLNALDSSEEGSDGAKQASKEAKQAAQAQVYLE